MKNQIFTIWIVVLIIGVPLGLVFILEKNLFNFTIGEVDSWIMFWGSYIGAIIGASVVYFVARLQIQKQHEKQMEAIKLENIQSTKRGMRSFYVTNKLEKIEEMLIETEKLMVIVKDLYNDLILFAMTMDVLDKQEAEDRELEFEQRIDFLKSDYHDHYDSALMGIYKLRGLSNYVPVTREHIHEIDQRLEDVFERVKTCYKTDAYKEYVVQPDKKTMPGQFGETFNNIVDFNVNILQKELAHTLDEIKTYIKLP